MAGPYKYLGDTYAAGAYLGREQKLTSEVRTEIDDWYAAGPCTRQRGEVRGDIGHGTDGKLLWGAMNRTRGQAHDAGLDGPRGAGAQGCCTQNGEARLSHARTRNEGGRVRGGHAWNERGGAWRELARNGRTVARRERTRNGPGNARPRCAPNRRASLHGGRARNDGGSARRDGARNGWAVSQLGRAPDERVVPRWARTQNWMRSTQPR